MDKDKTQKKGSLLSGIFIALKAYIPYLLALVIIIILIVFHFDQSSSLANIETKLNSSSLEIKTIKSIITKEFNDLDETLKTLYADIQKISAVNQDEAKALSAFSEDTGFLKKWIVENNTTTLKSIDELKKELNSLKKSIEYIRTKINTLQNSAEKAENQTSSAMKVDAVSI